jgi:hypothetical protein
MGNIRIIATSGTAVTEVPDEVATDLADTYAALKNLPVTRSAVQDFSSPEAARLFVRQGIAWATAQEPPLEFMRRAVPGTDKIKDNPNTVAFRIYVPAPADSPRRVARPRKPKDDSVKAAMDNVKASAAKNRKAS